MPEESTPTIPILLGTSRVGCRSARVARYLLGELEGRRECETGLIDLAGLDLPVMRHRLGDTVSPPPGAVDLSAKLARADGLLIVAPEYKNGYPGSLKNAVDYLEAGILRRKPVGIITVSSGGFGGINCLAQLRLVCLALGGAPIPVALPVARVEETFDQEGGLRDAKLAGRMGPFLDELVWYTQALVRQRGRAAESPPDREGRS
jgi:NAD(P)H-dependent FMN reductase